MGLVNYVTAIADFAEVDWRNSHTVLNLLANTPKSRQYTQMFLNSHPNGGFGFDSKVSLWELANTAALQSDGYQTLASYPSTNADPSSVTYTKPTDTVLTPKVDRIAIAKFQLGVNDLEQHPNRDEIVRQCAAAGAQLIGDEQQQMILSEMFANGQVEAGAATAFGLRTTSEANFIADMKDIAAGTRTQDKGNYANWLIILPHVYEGIISYFSVVSSRDYQEKSSANITDARVYRFGGFDFVFTPSYETSGMGVAVNLDKVVFIKPRPMQIRQIQDYATPLSDFYAMWQMWGFACLGKDIGSAYDGVATNGIDREGILQLSVS